MENQAVNARAMQELEIVSKACNTADALAAGIANVIRKYGATEEVIKEYPNGLCKVRILDKDGLFVGEYTTSLERVGEFVKSINRSC